MTEVIRWGLLAAMVVYVPWTLARVGAQANAIRAGEEQRNLEHRIPEPGQLAWHAVHVRDDVILLCLLVKLQIFVALATLAMLAFR